MPEEISSDKTEDNDEVQELQKEATELETLAELNKTIPNIISKAIRHDTPEGKRIGGQIAYMTLVLGFLLLLANVIEKLIPAFVMVSSHGWLLTAGCLMLACVFWLMHRFRNAVDAMLTPSWAAGPDYDLQRKRARSITRNSGLSVYLLFNIHLLCRLTEKAEPSWVNSTMDTLLMVGLLYVALEFINFIVVVAIYARHGYQLTVDQAKMNSEMFGNYNEFAELVFKHIERESEVTEAKEKLAEPLASKARARKRKDGS